MTDSGSPNGNVVTGRFGGASNDSAPVASDWADNKVNEFKRAAASVAGTAEREDMADQITRQELDARLATVSAEAKASAAELRADFARASEQMSSTVSSLSVAVADLKGAIASTQGSIDGLKSSIATMQWFIASLVAVFGLVGAALGVWIAWAQLKQAETPQPQTTASSSVQPIVIQVPAYLPATAANPDLGDKTPKPPSKETGKAASK